MGEEVVVSLERAALRRAVQELPDREREVVKRRFGLDGDPRPARYATIALQLSLTPHEVRKLEAQALSRLSQLRELDALGPVA